MIAFTRVASMAPARHGEAIAAAHEIARYVKGAHGVDFEVLLPIAGHPQRVAWSSRHTDLAALEALNARIADDARYWAIMRSAAGNFLPGSMHDSIWRTASLELLGTPCPPITPPRCRLP